MRKAMVLGVLGLAGTLATPAMADEFSGFRLGMVLAQEKLESDLFFDPVLDTQSLNNNRFGYGLFGGWGLNRYFAVELGLRGGTDFSSKPFREYLVDPENDFVTSHTEVLGADMSLVGSVWIGNKFAIFGRAGMFGWKAEQTMSVGSYDDPAGKVTVAVDDTGFEPMFGVGLQTVLDGALVRIEYRQTEIGNLGAAGAFNLRDNTLSSLDFSIVWILR